MKYRIWILLAVLMVWPTSLLAATRAWLEQPQVVLGQAVTLNVETDAVSATPDLTPLMRDFEVEGQSDSRSVRLVNGRMSTSTTFSLTLRPRRAGTLAIPALQVGNERTAPLTLEVGATATARAASNGLVFVETEVDDPSPYVQQSVGVTVRLYYATPLVSGQLDLDPPDGALLQRVGDIVQSSREIDGRRYSTAERRFLLVPERSGALTLPGARFEGRGAGGWMDDLLGGNSREVNITGAPRALQVRAQPAGAPQPWLPVRDLRLRYTAVPQQLRTGEAGTFTIETTVIGATQAQLPEVPAPSVPGAQVFAEPPQFDERFVGGTPQVTLTRRYSIVPSQAGTLVIPGSAMAWWDVRAGAARRATLPDLTLPVVVGSGAPSSASATSASRGAATTTTGAGDDILLEGERRVPPHLWPWLAAGFAVLWLVTLVWALTRRAAASSGQRTRVRAEAGAPDTTVPATHTAADLKRALDAGELDDIEDVLRGMARPAAVDLDDLHRRLASSSQRTAVDLLRRARWAGGDAGQARAALREAFRGGPDWKTAGPLAVDEPLPPLYPR
ncbi:MULTISPECIES: BatD family protein [unclassified Pseudoxanthomonas]|uniref:BatD family protein n=1 Tax=unclassified Pseudoxanthomonas TaxID=2645906 RepID=UPI0008E8990C|nr:MULTISPECIES: BatD family protein [unclassified Pseudoxanthomonas]PPJ43257.1 protein BatD [Pseudoxanthomonas sp. KAs_5_3]SFV34613.1 Oxygen tolerance [Pseudoxanthomonas sp. YR558]